MLGLGALEFRESGLALLSRTCSSSLVTYFQALCKSNESVIRRNSRISGLFDEKWRIFVLSESLQKIRTIFAKPIVVIDANF